MDLSGLISHIDEIKKVGENSSLEEIEKAIADAQYVRDQANSLQMGAKLYINSCYGAMAAPYFIGYNVKVAEAITLQGQDVIHFASQSMEDYFKKLWPLDKKVHRVLGVTKPGEVSNAVTVYGDTDSVSKSMVLQTNIKNSTIEDIYESCIEDAESILFFKNGNEILKPANLTTLNYDSGELKQTKVKYLIRHKVNKPKYRIKTKTGKEIIVTDDHSCIVFRNGEKLTVKAFEILPTDKILVINS